MVSWSVLGDCLAFFIAPRRLLSPRRRGLSTEAYHSQGKALNAVLLQALDNRLRSVLLLRYRLLERTLFTLSSGSLKQEVCLLPKTVGDFRDVLLKLFLRGRPCWELVAPCFTAMCTVPLAAEEHVIGRTTTRNVCSSEYRYDDVRLVSGSRTLQLVPTLQLKTLDSSAHHGC